MTDETSGVGYVDIYLLPIPADRVDEYRAQATNSGSVVRELGGLSYREFRGDDLGEAFTKIADADLLTAAVAEFESRAHRDQVMAAVMEDPRVTAMLEPVADMSRMRYGGFETFVTA